MIHFSRRFPWISFGRSTKANLEKTEREPLREFVYLDEVSLVSLLASQKGELTENITAQSQEELLAEAGGKLGTNVPLLPSAEISSRFQTTNSSTLQTVRKANAQSLFRELYKLEHLRRIQPIKIHSPADSFSQLLSGSCDSAVFKASDLKRGDLVEFQVKLAASWIFQISTLVAEFSDMFDESPTLFVDHVRFADLYDARNANKVINKLLAGLIPINGFAPDYSVIEFGNEEYIVHNGVIPNRDVSVTPLQIVGVTDHLAYWKDIRRILFADDEFTMLGRISKPGIQEDWNPIKLADVFKDFAPDLANQIEVSTRMAMAQSMEQSAGDSVEPNTMRLMIAMSRFKDILLDKTNSKTPDSQRIEINRLISELKVNAETAEGQRAAFSLVQSVVEQAISVEIDATEALAAREQVREELGLPLFPMVSGETRNPVVQEALPLKEKSSRLLNVEVVAIYW